MRATAAQYLLDMLRRVPGNAGFLGRYEVRTTTLCHSRLRANALLAVASDGAKYQNPPFSSKRYEAMARGGADAQRLSQESPGCGGVPGTDNGE